MNQGSGNPYGSSIFIRCKPDKVKGKITKTQNRTLPNSPNRREGGPESFRSAEKKGKSAVKRGQGL